MIWFRVYILLCLFAVACAIEEPSGEEKFISLGQKLGADLNDLSLIQQVHTRELVIGYAFADNNGCSTRYTDSQVKTDISDALNAWLDTLRGWSGLVASKGPIVSKFTYVKGQFVIGTPLDTDIAIGKEKHIRLANAEAYPSLQLWVTFQCYQGRSTYFWFKDASYAAITMLDEGLNIDYDTGTLLHEIGHAFGLYDTYVEEAHGTTSDCGEDLIVGCQPLAVMNLHNMLFSIHGEKRLGVDDIAGIRYVYRDIHANEQTCPADYTNELTTSGCKPKHPLVFAIMNGDLLNAAAIIKNMNAGQTNEELSALINKQDGKGQTLLHYAALRSASHGGDMYHLLIEHGANPLIQNNAGEMAIDIILQQLELALDARNTKTAQSLVTQVLQEAGKQ